MVNIEGLLKHLSAVNDGKIGLVSHQASDTAGILYNIYGERLHALFSPEHGWFGIAAPGEKTDDVPEHPFWHVPVYSLYGAHRKPTPEMLAGLNRLVIDLQDIGVRCYTYLATLALVLEAAAEVGLPVTVLDRPIPLGGLLDGPCLEEGFASFVAPLNIPLCHGMTPGECAQYVVNTQHLDVDLTVIRLRDWNHQSFTPWMNFMPPSPAIRSWDSAVMYPATVFTEAFPALDCDREGPLAFRVFGAPWLDLVRTIDDLAEVLPACGLGARPHRYIPKGGAYAGLPIDGVLLSVTNPEAFYPITAGTIILAAIMGRQPDELMQNARLEWLDKLAGTPDIRTFISARETLSPLFQKWINAQDEFAETRVNLYV